MTKKVSEAVTAKKPDKEALGDAIKGWISKSKVKSIKVKLK